MRRNARSSRGISALAALLCAGLTGAAAAQSAPGQTTPSLTAPGQTAKPEIRVGVELILAVDVSRSIDPIEQTIQRRGYAAAFRSPEVQAAILEGGWGRVAITYLEWGGAANQVVLIPWTLIDSRAAADRFAARIEAEPLTSLSRTSISGAIRYAVRLFDGNGYRGLRRVIDISGDGPNNAGEPVTVARDAAVAQRITLNGLPLMTNTDEVTTPFGNWGNIPHLDRYYADCVIGGPGAFSLPVTSWEAFPGAVRRKMVLELAGRMPAPRARVVPAQAEAPVDCLIGEKMWRQRWGGGN
ncbi:DUF1194 domain-containing protein [Solirhodobacter olei]|uniref:DUF1194 domain-containing protein n=1 Tax=Solirhodobacter olei TaxID=2493082 RepID=UPI000FDC3DE2|nr:DUF1194 domain-containing protein [Solirhodobacter olei]